MNNIRRPAIGVTLVLFISLIITGSIKAQDTEKAQKSDAAPPQIVAPPVQVVIPPAPKITKKTDNMISIPARDPNAQDKFQEQAVVATNAQIGSVFGYRRDPFTRRARFHAGCDIKAQWGDPVGASLDGIVQFVGQHNGYGNIIIVNHGGGVTTHYAHLSSFEAVEGQEVKRGMVIGRAGSSGRATSPHLHYELRIDGVAIDPLQPVALDASSDFFKWQLGFQNKGLPPDSVMKASYTQVPETQKADSNGETQPASTESARPRRIDPAVPSTSPEDNSKKITPTKTEATGTKPAGDRQN